MPDIYEYFSNIKNLIPEVQTDSIVSRTIFVDNSMRVVLFAFAENQKLTEHTSSSSAILHVIDGNAQISIADDDLTAKPGTWIQLPPDLPHSVTADSDLFMLLYLFDGSE